MLYEEDIFEGTAVSVSRLMTSKEMSIVTRAAFDIYAVNCDINPIDVIIELDGYGYYMMNILVQLKQTLMMRTIIHLCRR